MVFLDESGVNINMTRRYGRAMHDHRVVDSTPLNTPVSTTVLGAIRLNGDIKRTTYRGGTTAEKFITYLKDILLPSMDKDDVLIMDNMRSHHAKSVKKFLDEHKVKYIYLPPYSPDLNPIEKLWSKMKAYLRKVRIQKADKISSGIEAALQTVTSANCKGWFHACGYLQ